MKKFSRMPKSEGSGGGAAAGGAAGAGLGGGGGGFTGSSVGVRVFSVGRYQVTLEESLAEGTGVGRRGRQVREAGVWRWVAEGPARRLESVSGSKPLAARCEHGCLPGSLKSVSVLSGAREEIEDVPVSDVVS